MNDPLCSYCDESVLRMHATTECICHLLETARKEERKKMSEDEKVNNWNNTHHQLGHPVTYQEVIGKSEIVTTKTRSCAWTLGGHTAVIQIEGIVGCVALDHISASAL